MSKDYSIGQILQSQLSIPKKLLTTYKSLGLNELDVMIILHIFNFFDKQIYFPTPRELSEQLTISEKECTNRLQKLMKKGYITIVQSKNNENQINEQFSLEPLWKTLFEEVDHDYQKEEGEIFILFEQEFGRPLSPFEIETINVWLDEDNLKPSLIKAALRESVLMGKLNFKYIDRILRDWKKKGIRSVEDAREATKSFHQNQSQKQVKTKKRDTSFYYNWLEE